jgi:hypothetical protein
MFKTFQSFTRFAPFQTLESFSRCARSTPYSSSKFKSSRVQSDFHVSRILKQRFKVVESRGMLVLASLGCYRRYSGHAWSKITLLNPP